MCAVSYPISKGNKVLSMWRSPYVSYVWWS